MTETKKTKPEISLAEWEDAIRRLLAKRGTTEITLPDGEKATRETNPTDPPDNIKIPRGMRKPGPLPALVAEKDIDRRATTEVHDHSSDTRPDLDHLAHVVVCEARRIHAKGVAVRTPVHDGKKWTLSVVLVK